MTRAHWTNLYIGTPYVEFGREISGCDCWGLACVVYAAELGILLPTYSGDYAGTEERAEISALIGTAKGNATWQASQPSPRPFDIAVFRRGAFDSHVGIVVSATKMLHMVDEDAAKLEDWTSGRWALKLTGVYRHFQMAARLSK